MTSVGKAPARKRPAASWSVAMPRVEVARSAASESGPCALTTCDEERDSCYQPDSFVCSTSEETRCKPIDGKQPKCPGMIQRCTTTTRCSGTSAACNGVSDTNNFHNVEDCRGKCNADTVTCEPTIQCSNAYRHGYLRSGRILVLHCLRRPAAVLGEWALVASSAIARAVGARSPRPRSRASSSTYDALARAGVARAPVAPVRSGCARLTVRQRPA